MDPGRELRTIIKINIYYYDDNQPLAINSDLPPRFELYSNRVMYNCIIHPFSGMFQRLSGPNGPPAAPLAARVHSPVAPAVWTMAADWSSVLRREAREPRPGLAVAHAHLPLTLLQDAGAENSMEGNFEP